MTTTIPIETIRELMRHMEWADSRVWSAVLAHPQSRHDPRTRDLLQHLHGVQRVFLAVWKSESYDLPAVDAPWDAEAARSAVQACYEELRDVLSRFDAAMLGRSAVMPSLARAEQRLGRKLEAPTLAETMVQVVIHSTHHRGQ